MLLPELLFWTTSFFTPDHICHHQFQKKKTRSYMNFQSGSFEEQHAAQHALLQSSISPGMLLCRAACRQACSSAEQHSARHALLLSNITLGMFCCRATCRPACSSDLVFVSITAVCFCLCHHGVMFHLETTCQIHLYVFMCLFA